MAIDPSIPLQVKQFDIGESLRNAEAIAASRQERQYRQMQMDKYSRDDARDTERRASLADYLLSAGDGRNAPQASGPTVGGVMGGQSGFVPGNLAAPAHPSVAGNGGAPLGDPSQAGPSQASGPAAYERAVRADPEGFLTFEGNRLGITEKQLKAHSDLNNSAMQLLGGVYDQQSYDRAKAVARQLYAQHGVNLDEMGLPDQYSPELVRSLQMQGMDTAHQVQAIARENKLNWDQYDDEQDNARADTLAGSTVEDRNARRELTRERVQIARQRANAAAKGGADKPAGPPKTENALFTDIQRRFNAGETITDRERQFSHDYQLRHGGRAPQPRGGRAAAVTDGAIIRNPRTGQRLTLQGGQWVPVK